MLAPGVHREMPWARASSERAPNNSHRRKMKIGLAGLGREDDWTVEIDEIVGANVCGITMSNRQISLQVSPLSMDIITKLAGFLRSNEEQGKFHLPGVFGGKLEFVDYEGRLLIRLVEARKSAGTNLLEITLQTGERNSMTSALDQAIEDAGK